MKLLGCLVIISCMVALATSSGPRIDTNTDETESDADLIVENEMIDDNSSTDNNCEASNDYEVADDEAMVEEENYENHVEEKKPAYNLKDGKTCRLKTEGEKLSKIIRKTGTAKQKSLNKHALEGESENFDTTKKTAKFQPSKKHRKAKRDMLSSENQQKVSKKNVKTTSGATKGDSNNKKKTSSTINSENASMGNKKDTSSRAKSYQKSSKKHQRGKKTSKNEL